ncbi:hypothetical protein [Sphingobium baderi]|uniref:Uncharacterized protein n=1 Tax=Sphingobium baderi TaxID=1332080 RepID=A0A0S3EZQ8_9SPHN|nr:hypothetical protein [Sphingobium baderi]ALR20905.1 hypothetical protein ATN00_11955 [Sphingobium baderi]
MLPIRRLLDRMIDRRPVVRSSRHSFRKPWWRRSGRAWRLLALMLALIGTILLVLPPATAIEEMPAAASAPAASQAPSDNSPDSP